MLLDVNITPVLKGSKFLLLVYALNKQISSSICNK